MKYIQNILYHVIDKSLAYDVAVSFVPFIWFQKILNFFIITREYSKLDKSIKQHFLKCHASTLNVKDKKSTFTQGTKGIAGTQL